MSFMLKLVAGHSQVLQCSGFPLLRDWRVTSWPIIIEHWKILADISRVVPRLI